MKRIWHIGKVYKLISPVFTMEILYPEDTLAICVKSECRNMLHDLCFIVEGRLIRLSRNVACEIISRE